ncbi:MAG: hypothetical protein KGQ38_01960 [Actinomycetales bacterium]|nr:hypothetical protein [Actinomycetales bacterium]
MKLSDQVAAVVHSALQPESEESVVADAVRTSLDLFAKAHPGRSVELRVPPYRVVQVVGGTTHRRGTPPAVVEMSAQTWLKLIAKQISWAQAVANGQIQASGVASDLSELLN